MFRTLAAALSLISLSGSSAWAQMARVVAGPVVPIAVPVASLSGVSAAAPALLAPALAPSALTAPGLAAAPVPADAAEAPAAVAAPAQTPAALAPGAGRGRRESRRTAALGTLGAVAIIAVAAASYTGLIYGWGQMVQQWENGMQESLRDFQDEGFPRGDVPADDPAPAPISSRPR